MVELLLQFIRAEITGNWKLYLDTVAAVTPYVFGIEWHNHARWLPIYLADINQMESKHLTMYREFMSGNHLASQSNNPFFQESIDIIWR